MKKISSILLAVLIIIQIFSVVSFAEDVNEFPPKRPSVGNMKIAVSENGESVLGLRTNGTINFRAKLYQGVSLLGNASKATMLSLTNIVDVACANYEFVALRSDGTVFASERDDKAYTEELFSEANSWTDIVAIDCGSSHLVGLKADGTVITTGDNSQGQCDVLGWNNVSKIYAQGNTTVAIRKDGTVLAAGVIGNFSELRKIKNVKEVFKLADFGLVSNNRCEALLDDGTVTLKKNAHIENGKIVKEGQEKTELSLDVIAKMLGCSHKIVSIKNIPRASSIYEYCFLDENGDLYLLHNFESMFHSEWNLTKLEENIIDFEIVGANYYALDENGQILSDAEAFTSADWILTTNITYNGEKVNSDVAPYIKDGRTLAPIRAILEALGMTVSWDAGTQTATAVKADINISVTINSNIAIVNGEQKTLDVAAEITGGRTFVPVRFFAEALNMNVDWDSYTKTVIIEGK